MTRLPGNHLTYSAQILGRNFLVLSQHPFSAPRLRPCHIAPKSVRPIHLYHPFYHVYIYIYVPTKLGYVDTFWYCTQFVNCWLVDKFTSFLGSNMDFIGYQRVGFALVVFQRILVEFLELVLRKSLVMLWQVEHWAANYSFVLVTLPETNSSQMKRWHPNRKPDHLPTIHFQVLCQVSFRESILPC